MKDGIEMYNRILVPLDSSDTAEQVLPYVCMLSKGLKAPVELLRVIEPVSPELTDPTHGLYLDRVAESMRTDSEEYLNKVASSLKRDGVAAATQVHEGDPATRILDEAQKDTGDLIAMTTHGRSGVTRWVFGSVTDKVLHGTQNPMLVVRARDSSEPTSADQIKTLIVPLDGSQEAEQVLPHVLALAKGLELKVMLVQSLPIDWIMYNEYGAYIQGHYETAAAQLEQNAIDYLKGAAKALSRKGVASVNTKFVHGHPATAVIDLAQDMEGSLIAMTTHGRSGVGRWVLGSVADKVVRQAGSPVLMVRTI